MPRKRNCSKCGSKKLVKIPSGYKCRNCGEILGSKRSLQLSYGTQRSKQKGLGSEFYGMRKYVFEINLD